MLWLSCPDGTLVYGQWHVQVCPRSTEFYMSPFIRSRLIHCNSTFPTGNGYEGTRRPKWEFVELPARASLYECSNFEPSVQAMQAFLEIFPLKETIFFVLLSPSDPRR